MMHQEKPKDPTYNNKGANYPAPSEILDTGDPGDSTQRAFRYQHGYGVILLVAGAIGSLPYKSIWCEHHEDLLCERSDNGLFDGYQIKTQKPENGAWILTDEALQKSIKRFVHLVDKFSNHIHKLFFATNAAFLDPKLSIKDHNKLAKSPRPFFRAIDESNSIEDIPAPFYKSFTTLREYCKCSDELLFETLKRVGLIQGPELESFETVISHEHISKLNECRRLDPTSLNQLRDELMQKVYYASSLYCQDPSRHWQILDRSNISNPVLLSKKLEVEIVKECIQEYKNVPFRYAPGLSDLKIKESNDEYSVLKTKIVHGGLAQQFDIMQHRTISTEQKLLELQYSKPEKFSVILNQLECVVRGECSEAQLKASLGGSPYGRQMLFDVYERLKSLAKEEPAKVEHFPYECLVGIAGLLTEDCKVWWSEEFDLGAAA